MTTPARTGSATTSSADVTLAPGPLQSGWLYVVNEDGAGRITFTVDGSTPTNGGDDMLYVAPVAGAFRRVFVNANTSGDVVVKIIASTATAYQAYIDKH